MSYSLLSIVFITIFFLVPDSQAAPSNQTINFSARLQSSSGGVVPDGYYNIGFQIYDQNTGGSPVWSEIHHDANGPTAGQDSRVRVVNGYFSTKLGSLESFGAIDWGSDLWLTMNIGGTSQIAATGSIPWDGEMTPRIQLSAVPYAMSASTIGGKSADQLVQLGQGSQEDASNNTSIAINKTGSGDLMQFQSSGSDVFTLSNAGNITLGSGTTDHLLTIGGATTGGGRSLTLSAGSTSDNASGGDLVLQGGSTSGIGVGGNIQIDAGSGSSGGGSIALGGVNASTVDIGNDSSTTTIKGSLGASSLVLGDVATSAAGELKIVSENGHTTTIINGGNLTQDQTLQLPTGSGTLCTQWSRECGFATLDGIGFQEGNLQIAGGGSFRGWLQLRTNFNTENALRIMDSSDKLVLGADTLNHRVLIGSADTTGTLLVLDTKTDEGDPTGVNGAMYYNSDRGKMRCYENDSWENCISNTKGAPITATSNHTADYGDFIIADSTTGAFSVTLPEPHAGAVISVKKINAGNTVQVVPSGTGVQIDNLSSVNLSSQWTSQDFYSDGIRWYRV